MKFAVDVRRVEECTVEIEGARDRDEAEALARAQRPGFQVESAAEVRADGEVGVEHIMNTRCEACGRAIWQGDAYEAGEDADLCDRCTVTA